MNAYKLHYSKPFFLPSVTADEIRIICLTIDPDLPIYIFVYLDLSLGL